MWVEFVVGPLVCSEISFSAGTCTPVFPFCQKPTLPNSNSILEYTGISERVLVNSLVHTVTYSHNTLHVEVNSHSPLFALLLYKQVFNSFGMCSLSESNDPFHVDDPFKTDPFHYKSVSFADPFPGDPFEVRRHQ